MATSQQTVTRAYRDLGALDINSEASAAMMNHGLDMLSRMIAGWASSGVNVRLANASKTGDTETNSNIISNMSSTTGVIAGMEVSGTGIQDGTTVIWVRETEVKISTLATADGTTVALTFSSLPIDAKYEDGVIAMLAVRLAPSTGLPVTTELKEIADNGWMALQAAYITAPMAQFDDALVGLSSTRHRSGF